MRTSCPVSHPCRVSCTHTHVPASQSHCPSMHSLVCLTPVSHLDILAHTIDNTYTHRLRQTDGGASLSRAPSGTVARPGRLPRVPLPAASPGPVPCPPMLAPASWVAAPHRPAHHGPLEAETGLHLGMRGHGRGQGLLRGHLSARTAVLCPCSYLRSPPGASQGCPQGWTLRWTSGRALLPGAATQTDWLAGAALGTGHPGPATTPPTLTPSEPACRAWAPLLRLTATLPKLPLRSPPASTREYQLVLALPSLGEALQKCCCRCPPEAPHLQKASSAPRSLQEVQRVLISCLLGVGLVRRLLGNL